MDIEHELADQDSQDLVLAGRLAIAYAMLVMAPYTPTLREGTPAQMAAYVIKTAKISGNYGKLREALK